MVDKELKTSADPNEKKSQSVRRGLIILLISLQLITVLLILSITHFSTSRDIDQQVTQLLQNALNESKEHTEGFLETAYRSVQLSTALLANGALDANDTQALDTYFLSQLQSNPEMTGIYLASPRGDFHFVTREIRDEQAGFLTKLINADAPGKASFLWRDDTLTPIESLTDQADEFKVLERPWYRKAVEQRGLIWTEPYIFYTSKKPGMTVASPYFDSDGNIAGIIGVDIELTSLSKFLANLKVFGSVSVFMVSESGNFVAAPSMSGADIVLDSLAVTSTDETELTLERYAVLQYLQNSKNPTQPVTPHNKITHDGDTYRLRHEPFLLKDGPVWIIAAYAPEDAFLSEIRSGENRNALIALLILFVSLVAGWLLIRRTWQPFERFFHDVITDQLTGLFNRRFLENIGSRMYIRLLRDQHEAISIAVIDLDHFKKINLEFGSAIGNRVLISFADFLRRTLRPEDIITRYSGDTFVVIFPGMSNECAVNVVDRMRKQLDAWPLQVKDLLIRLTFSAGVETIDDKTRIADAAFTDFIEVAKRAMQEAKRNGRDAVESANIRQYKVKE